MNCGDLLQAYGEATAFCGNGEERHRLGTTQWVVFLGETRWQQFKAWEAKVLTQWGPAWMWCSDLFFDGTLLSKTEHLVQQFRIDPWPTPELIRKRDFR